MKNSNLNYTTAAAFATILLAAGCSGAPAAQGGRTGGAVGQTAPEIAAAQWFNHKGTAPALADLRGKVVVVEFWATWCPPCRRSIPHLIKLTTTYKDKGVVVIGMTSEDAERAGLAKFIKGHRINYIIGAGSNTSRAYGVRGIPTAFVINPTGKIDWRGHPMGGLDAAVETAVEKYKPAAKAAAGAADTPAKAEKTGASGNAGSAETPAPDNRKKSAPPEKKDTSRKSTPQPTCCGG